MSRIQRHSLDWAGDMIHSPHGDWVHISDVQRLEDDLDARQAAQRTLMARLAEVEAELAELKAAPPPVAEPAHVAGGRLFGWVAPHDARLFNSGRKSSCRVYKKRTELFCMPLSNLLGPNHYQKPPVGEVVTVCGGLKTKVLAHCPEGLVVEGVIDLEMIATKWSWNNAKEND